MGFCPCKVLSILVTNRAFYMVGVAQLVEPLVVAQVVVGSSPITHPIRHQKAVAVRPQQWPCRLRARSSAG